MSGPEAPGNPPPEVPEEYLAAYTEAYQRALADEPSSVPPAAVEPASVATSPAPEAMAGTEPPAPRSPRPRWLPAVLMVLLALVLVLGAYGLGRIVSDDPEVASPKPVDTPVPGSSPRRPAGAWGGAVEPVAATTARATCTARPGVDAAGSPVRYPARNTIDGDTSTAWRCPGQAIGEKLTFRLGSDVDVAEVGLIPGYAKTDASSGQDRYAENNRITRVRWTLSDDVSVVQRLDADPQNRAVQVLRVPRTRTDRITLEILAVRGGPKNTTAISEIQLAAAAD